MYSTDTEDEARLLVAMTCPKAVNGNYVAEELVREQTLENLRAFSDRIDLAARIRKAKGKRREVLVARMREMRLRAMGVA